jgi:hypothetical protein
MPSHSPVIPIIIIVPLLVSSVIISLIHPTTEVCDIVFGIVPFVLDVLRNVLDLLHFLSSPSGCVLWKVLDVVDGIVESVLYAIVEVLDATDLLARPASRVLGEVGDVVAELVDTVFNSVLVAFEVVIYKSPHQNYSSIMQHGYSRMFSPSCISRAPPATPAAPAAAYFHPLPPCFFSCSCCW